MSKTTIQRAAEAHTDLTVFGIVASILEGGHLYRPGSNKSAQRIIDICHREQQRLLSEYDNAVGLITGKL